MSTIFVAKAIYQNITEILLLDLNLDFSRISNV